MFRLPPVFQKGIRISTMCHNNKSIKEIPDFTQRYVNQSIKCSYVLWVASYNIKILSGRYLLLDKSKVNLSCKFYIFFSYIFGSKNYLLLERKWIWAGWSVPSVCHSIYVCVTMCVIVCMCVSLCVWVMYRKACDLMTKQCTTHTHTQISGLWRKNPEHRSNHCWLLSHVIRFRKNLYHILET